MMQKAEKRTVQALVKTHQEAGHVLTDGFFGAPLVADAWRDPGLPGYDRPGQEASPAESVKPPAHRDLPADFRRVYRPVAGIYDDDEELLFWVWARDPSAGPPPEKPPPARPPIPSVFERARTEEWTSSETRGPAPGRPSIRKGKVRAGSKKVGLVLPAEMHRALSVRAAEEGIRLSALVERVLAGYLKGGDDS